MCRIFGSIVSSDFLSRATAQLLNDGKYLADWRQAILDVIDAVYFLHQIGTSHQNLRPECFGVSKHNGCICILDFESSQKEGWSYCKTRTLFLNQCVLLNRFV